MLKQFGDTDDPMVANFVAWTCALASGALRDYDPVIALAKKAAEERPDSGQFRNTLGAILHRAGRHDDAIEQLTELDRRWEAADHAIQSSPAYTWYFLAMAHQKAGNDERAREYLTKANRATDEALVDEKNPPAWNRQATLGFLRKEADRLVGMGGEESMESGEKPDRESNI
jgi:tetratricopeptide (TPR) repeat protein